MVVIEGDQSIPAERLDQYRATLGEATPGKMVRKRYPYRLPRMQDGRFGASAKQIAQRERFKIARNAFKKISRSEKERWYANRPIWNSYLWYYNYFIMSSLCGNADISDGGAGVIKVIKQGKVTVPKTGGYNVNISTIDSDKAVVMLYGSATKVPRVIHSDGSIATGGTTLNLGATVDPDKCTVKLFGASKSMAMEGDYPYVWNIFPYVDALTATQIQIKWAQTPDSAANVSFEVTEHNEGNVYPIFSALSNTNLTIDWSDEPDAAADVSYIVIEYI